MSTCVFGIIVAGILIPCAAQANVGYWGSFPGVPQSEQILVQGINNGYNIIDVAFFYFTSTLPLKLEWYNEKGHYAPSFYIPKKSELRKQTDRDFKYLLSVGGAAGMPPGNDLLSDPETRAEELFQSFLEQVSKYEFDGVDLDIEKFEHSGLYQCVLRHFIYKLKHSTSTRYMVAMAPQPAHIDTRISSVGTGIGLQAGFRNWYAPLVDMSIINDVDYITMQWYNQGVDYPGGPIGNAEGAKTYIEALKQGYQLDTTAFNQICPPIGGQNFTGTVQITETENKFILGFPIDYERGGSGTRDSAPLIWTHHDNVTDFFLKNDQGDYFQKNTAGVMFWTIEYDTYNGHCVLDLDFEHQVAGLHHDKPIPLCTRKYKAPTTPAPPSTSRCGVSWGDANGRCGSPCSDNSHCPSGLGCYASLQTCDSLSFSISTNGRLSTGIASTNMGTTSLSTNHRGDFEPPQPKKDSSAIRWFDSRRRSVWGRYRTSSTYPRANKDRSSGAALRALLEDRMCCEAMTADCLACVENISVHDYCQHNPDIEGCPHANPDLMCCEAMIADCLACAANMSVQDYCKHNPDTHGCSHGNSDLMCCEAMTADCLACGANTSVHDYCQRNPDIEGCPGAESTVQSSVSEQSENVRMCCEAMVADCLACSEDVTIEEFCQEHPDTPGCPGHYVVV